MARPHEAFTAGLAVRAVRAREAEPAPRAGAAPGGRVVLLRDEGWPDVPGVCCWRHGVREAFGGAGAQVEEIGFRPPSRRPAGAPAAAPRSNPRLSWLPPLVRRPLAVAYRAGRRRARQLSRLVPAAAAARRTVAARTDRARNRPILTGLAGAALVIAESPECARAAAASGVPRARLWALALPLERLVDGAASDQADRIGAVAPLVGGMLADSDAGRESVERAAASTRVRVEVYPPVAVDRACPSCGSSGTSPRHAPPGQRHQLPPEVSRLVAWRALVAERQAGAGAEGPSSGTGGPAGFRDERKSDAWPDLPPPPAPLGQPEPGQAPPDLSCDAQLRVARGAIATASPVTPAVARAARCVVVSGFDLKFVRELAGRLDRRADLRLALDEWPALGSPSARTGALLAGAQSVLAEWARPSAVWLSRHKRPGQFLIVRLHRYELDCRYPRDIDMDNVDAVVHVSRPVGRRILAELGWPPDKLVYIPNFVDLDWFDRAKLPGARFGIGMVGVEFANKRFDLALDLLTRVRRHDPRFTLFVRSVMPWHNRYAWQRPDEREYVSRCLDRIERDELLRGAVTFDPPGQDMARWYRRVGHILSMSDVESFHLAVAEGMASGAVPVIRPWSGAEEIYTSEWIHPSLTEAATAILAGSDEAEWRRRAGLAKAEIRRTVDPEAIVNAWADLLHGDQHSARRHFAAGAGS